jgi:hypothetical protein
VVLEVEVTARKEARMEARAVTREVIRTEARAVTREVTKEVAKVAGLAEEVYSAKSALASTLSFR